MNEKKILISAFVFFSLLVILIILMMLTYDIKKQEMRERAYEQKNKPEITNYPKVEIEVRK